MDLDAKTPPMNDDLGNDLNAAAATHDSADNADRYNVPALERGLRVLSEFSRDNRTLTAPELARRFKLPRSTVFRLLSTLENMGFIERDEGGREYRLSVGVLRLGFEYLASQPLNELGMPVLQRLSDDVRLTCNLVVRDGRSIVYVAKVSPPSPFASSVNVGTRLPAHATVLGRILLEDLSLSDLQKLYPEDKLEAFSANTPTTLGQLYDMVQADRQRGYVLGEGFFESNISSVAAPVRDHTGHVVAAMGATVTAAHVEDGRVEALVQRVRAAADELSALLNYAPAVSGRNVVPLRGRNF